MQMWAPGSGLAAPLDQMAVAPECHGKGPDVLAKGTEGGEPRCAQHHVVFAQGKHEDVIDEGLIVDEERRLPENPGTWHLLAIGHSHQQRTRNHLEAGGRHTIRVDEVVRRAGVD